MVDSGSCRNGRIHHPVKSYNRNHGIFFCNQQKAGAARLSRQALSDQKMRRKRASSDAPKQELSGRRLLMPGCHSQRRVTLLECRKRSINHHPYLANRACDFKNQLIYSAQLNLLKCDRKVQQPAEHEAGNSRGELLSE